MNRYRKLVLKNIMNSLVLEYRIASRRISNSIMIHVSKIYLTWREVLFTYIYRNGSFSLD